MKGTEIKLGYAPTRRSIFSAPDAIKYRGLTKDRLLELGVSFVDIDGPYTKGTYLWVEVENWKRLEAKLVEAPTSTTAWASTRMWCLCCLKPANIWE